jgi:hypothetical protein
MANYYPAEINLAQIIRKYRDLQLVDPIEQQRLVDVEDRKRRGKGAPKKAKTKGLLFPDLALNGFRAECWPRQPTLGEVTENDRVDSCFVVRLLSSSDGNHAGTFKQLRIPVKTGRSSVSLPSV